MRNKKWIVNLTRAHKGRNPLNRFDADVTNYGAALNSIYINDKFLPKSDHIQITIQEIHPPHERVM